MKKKNEKVLVSLISHHVELVSASINVYDSALTGKMDRFRNKFGMTTRRGFTLAEVLITLGIIGVVAAMTIPTLTVNINERQWSTAADVFEKKLNESLKTMNTQQTIYGHTTTLSFVNELAKNFKINKICKNNELQNCFSETVYWGVGEATPEEVDMKEIKQASDFGLDDWGTELIGVQFANGVSGLVAYNPSCWGDPYSNQFEGTGCISMLYDTSGDKNPNTSGKDLGNYGVINRLGGADCAFEISGTCYTTLAFIPEPVSIAECEQMLDDGLEIGGCYFSNDYWVGAIKACGGINKLPTAAQLGELADYLYNTNGIGQTDKSNLVLDIEKATSLGFTLEADDSFQVFSNQEHFAGGALFRYYKATSTQWTYNTLTQNKSQALCIK